MLKLREYQAKEIFKNYGIRIPPGIVVRSPDEAVKAAKELGTSVVLKPQLGVKGRGKVGGIAFAHNPDEVMTKSNDLFAMTIKGEPVRELLVQEMVDISDELYVAVTIDYGSRCPVLIASAAGGMDIETVAKEDPDRVFRIPVDILTGKMNLDPVRAALGDDVADCLKTLYKIFRETDAEMAEINPLARQPEGGLIAIDAVLNINDDSLFRHPDLLEMKKVIPVENPFAEEAAARSWTYIDLEGDIGILSSGAGLTMAIMDLLNQYGGRPANFLDTAQMDETGVFQAFEFLFRAKPVRAVLVNIFAGLNRCDDLATGIRRYIETHNPSVPIIVRMAGNRETEGHAILEAIGIHPLKGLEDAVQSAVTLTREVRS